jgi:hypothetical protein
MKLLKSLLLVLVLATYFVACKKEKDEPAFNMVGDWNGKLGDNIGIPTGHFHIKIKPNGVLERYNAAGTHTATGTWQLSGNAFTGTYTFSDGGTVVNIQGTLNRKEKFMSGTWQNDGNETGKWNATQQ